MSTAMDRVPLDRNIVAGPGSFTGKFGRGRTGANVAAMKNRETSVTGVAEVGGKRRTVCRCVRGYSGVSKVRRRVREA